MPDDFSRVICTEARNLFPDGAVEVLVFDPSDPAEAKAHVAVKLIHTSSGIEASCSDFPTQIQNCALAAIRLRIACDEQIT